MLATARSKHRARPTSHPVGRGRTAYVESFNGKLFLLKGDAEHEDGERLLHGLLSLCLPSGSPIEVVELSKEWAYEFGTATTTYTPQGSQAAKQLHDTYLVLFRNTGKGWKAYREVASSGPPPGGWPVD